MKTFNYKFGIWWLDRRRLLSRFVQLRKNRPTRVRCLFPLFPRFTVCISEAALIVHLRRRVHSRWRSHRFFPSPFPFTLWRWKRLRSIRSSSAMSVQRLIFRFLCTASDCLSYGKSVKTCAHACIRDCVKESRECAIVREEKGNKISSRAPKTPSTTESWTLKISWRYLFVESHLVMDWGRIRQKENNGTTTKFAKTRFVVWRRKLAPSLEHSTERSFPPSGRQDLRLFLIAFPVNHF